MSSFDNVSEVDFRISEEMEGQANTTTGEPQEPASQSTRTTAEPQDFIFAPTLPSQVPPKPFPRRQLSRRSKGVGELAHQLYSSLKNALFQLIFPHRASPIRPAQVTGELKKAMLARENYLEDARYRKIVPNVYVVQLNRHNYTRYYQPIESELCEQWQKKLKVHLATTNSRLKSNDYVCLGPIEVQIQPVTDLAQNEVDITCQIVKQKEVDDQDKMVEQEEIDDQDELVEQKEVDPSSSFLLSACLERQASGRQWALKKGIVTIGRDEECEVYLDMPIVQETCLISSNHAYIRYQDNTFRLFDGSPNSKPSSNGTFVNRQPIEPDGHLLQDGDTIILAALDANDPRPDTPGVVELLFRLSCA